MDKANECNRKIRVLESMIKCQEQQKMLIIDIGGFQELKTLYKSDSNELFECQQSLDHCIKELADSVSMFETFKLLLNQ